MAGNTKGLREKGLAFCDLARKAALRGRSKQDYALFQQAQAALVWEDMAREFALDSVGFVIDLGCGRGGYTEFFSRKIPSAIGVDYHVEPSPGALAAYLAADLLTFESARPADLVFCASVIEHVEDAAGLVRQARAILRPGGFLYLSFPPFLSPTGGHALAPLHYLPDRVAFSAGKKLGWLSPQVTGYADMFGTWGLFRRSIKDVRALLEHEGFEILCCKPRFFGDGVLNPTSWPLVADFLTWHAEFYCRRPA
jgi:SAM-dependent methyltransferase